MLIGSYSIQIWWGLYGITKFYRSYAAFEHRGIDIINPNVEGIFSVKVVVS